MSRRAGWRLSTAAAFVVRTLPLLVTASILAACHDPGLGPVQYCAEDLTLPVPGNDQQCGVKYTACSDSFACSWVIECVPNAEGSAASCTCREADPQVHCNVGLRTPWPSTALCGAITAGDRPMIRQLAVGGCFPGMSPTMDEFSRIP